MPPSAALIELQQEGIGKRTLDWMLIATQLSREWCGIDYRFLSLLANHVIAEAQEDLFW